MTRMSGVNEFPSFPRRGGRDIKNNDAKPPLTERTRWFTQPPRLRPLRWLRDISFMGAAAEMAQPQTEPNPGPTLWIREALAKLQPDHREVLMLREYEQLSYDEIAAVLEMPVNTVRSRLFRARAELKTLLEPQTAREAS